VDRIFAADTSPTLRKKGEYNGASRMIRWPEETVRETVARETGGRGVHSAILLSAQPDPVREAIESLGRGGSAILGIPPPSSVRLGFTSTLLQSREMRFQGVPAFHPRDLKTAVNALKQGTVNGESLISRRIPWAKLDGERIEPGYWEHATHVVVEGPR
jgi:threonine dehydrogenase-like Zn-dependent dehydrogenase